VWFRRRSGNLHDREYFAAYSVFYLHEGKSSGNGTGARRTGGRAARRGSDDVGAWTRCRRSNSDGRTDRSSSDSRRFQEPEVRRRDADHSYPALRALAVIGPPGVTGYAAVAAGRLAARDAALPRIASIGNVTAGWPAAAYNRHRPHRGRNPRPPDCDDITMGAIGGLAATRIQRRWVLGGLINEYERAA
jgi:hypothetical protein